MTRKQVFCWVVALKAEAQGVMESHSLTLNRQFGGGGFEVFSNDSESQFLIVSGIGKIRAASAVSWLAAKLDLSRMHPLWINFGIGGNQVLPIGTVVRGGRIQDQGSQRSWFPHPLKRLKGSLIKPHEILTLDQPCFDYPEAKWVIEMEAAGFASTALRFSTVEWVQCFKVISDNKNSDPKLIKADWVAQLCADALPEFEIYLQKWSELAKQFLTETAAIDCEVILETYHFTETEKHQFRRLIQRALVLQKFDPKDCENWVSSLNAKTGKVILIHLRELLANTEAAKN